MSAASKRIRMGFRPSDHVPAADTSNARDDTETPRVVCHG